jgi:translation initiation factor 1A
MPQKKNTNGKSKRKKRERFVNDDSKKNAKMIKRSDEKYKGCEYAIITKVLGQKRFKAKIVNNTNELINLTEIMVRAPGKMRRSDYVARGDVVLVYPWEYQKDKGDIIFRYTSEEVYNLLLYKVIDQQEFKQLTKEEDEEKDSTELTKKQKQKEKQKEKDDKLAFVFDDGEGDGNGDEVPEESDNDGEDIDISTI